MNREAKKSQGAESNFSGKTFESSVEREFVERGVHPVAFNSGPRGNNGNSDLFNPRQLIRNVPYTSIYGSRSKSEFVYQDKRRHIRIECRWQQVPGSVDEKLPYLFLNALNAMPEPEIWICCDGSGARRSAIRWLQREALAASRENKKITVLESFADIRKAVKRLLTEEDI